MRIIRPIDWIPDQPGTLLPGQVEMLDQTLLPVCEQRFRTRDPEAVWQAIKTLQVRGAPAIGIAAAMGMAAAFQSVIASSGAEALPALKAIGDYLATSRPTAVNLFWAIDRMQKTAEANRHRPLAELKQRLVEEALRIRDEDAAMCRAIGRHGAALLHDGDTVLTHCNAGGLATAEYGTALAPIYTAAEAGLDIRVFADETRPLLQGSRLTAWELMQAGIDVTVICDNMAAQVMKEGRVNIVFTGADRIAANGDAANKIGTYGVALAARAHNIPFYVCAPTSTLDMTLADGSQIPIEERAPEEVTCGFGRQTAPDGAAVYSPAFDVTPADLISGIITEIGIARPDYGRSLRAHAAQSGNHTPA